MLQLSILKKYGVEAVVATPHFYPQIHSVEKFLLLREDGCRRLRALENRTDVAVYKGAEVLVCPGLDRMEGLEKLCIEGTRTILLEMPFCSDSKQEQEFQIEDT